MQYVWSRPVWSQLVRLQDPKDKIEEIFQNQFSNVSDIYFRGGESGLLITTSEQRFWLQGIGTIG